MSSFFSKRKLFYIGILIMMHALIEAHSIRGVLQKIHHGHGVDISVETDADSFFSYTKIIIIAVELICGMLIAILGFVARKQLKPARVRDHVSTISYYEQLNTGIAFNHFNHRGKMIGMSNNATSTTETTSALSGNNISNSKSLSEKKNQ